MPLIDEHVREVGRDVRELANLHGELARSEITLGLRRLVIGVFLFAVGVSLVAVALIASATSLYFLFENIVAPPAAAALVALVFLLFTGLLWLAAWRALSGSYALTLPRTRQMIWELLQWRDNPTNS